MWIEFRSSSFARIDVDESFKCRTEYRILKYEHVKKYTLLESLFDPVGLSSNQHKTFIQFHFFAILTRDIK